MDFDQEYMKAKMMKSGDQPLDMRLDADGVMRYYLPEEQAIAEEAPAAAPTPSLPEVVVTGKPEPVTAAKPAKKKPVAQPNQGQLDLGYATSKFEPAGAMGALKKVGELIQSGAEKIDFDVLGFPGIGTLTLKDLTVGDLGKVLVNIAEGMPPVTGSGQTLRPTMESVELINAAPAVTGAVKLAKKAGPKIAESLGPTVDKMAQDYLRKTGATMAVAPESAVAKNFSNDTKRRVSLIDYLEKFVDKKRKESPQAMFESSYFGKSGFDHDRGIARYVEKFKDELPVEVQQALHFENVRDLETGETLNALTDSVRGGHIAQLRRMRDDIEETKVAGKVKRRKEQK